MFLELERAIDANKFSKPEGDSLPGQLMLVHAGKVNLEMMLISNFSRLFHFHFDHLQIF